MPAIKAAEIPDSSVSSSDCNLEFPASIVGWLNGFDAVMNAADQHPCLS